MQGSVGKCLGLRHRQTGFLAQGTGCWAYGDGLVLVPDSLLGVPKGLSEAGEVRVEVGGRGDDLQEPGMDLHGEPGGQEGPVDVQLPGTTAGAELS